MKKNYDKPISLRCITCGETKLGINEDKTWIKCPRCGREYPGGEDELIGLNQELINREVQKSQDEILKDTEKDFTDSLKKAFKGNKNIKFKK